MKITAGVLLIIAALFNLFASFGYLAGGALTTGTSIVAEETFREAAKNDTSMESTSSQTEVDLGDVKAAGGGFMAFGIFLLISVGLMIAGAVFLFKGSNAGFITISGIVAIAAEVIGILIISFGVMNILGLVGGALAIFAARSIGGKVEEAPSEASV